jgi:protease I
MDKSAHAALVLVDTGFNEIETMYAKFRLEESGYRVFLTGPKAGEKYVGRFGYPCTSETSIYDVHERHYAGLICAGGWAPARLRTEGTVKSVVADMFRAGKLVAAICSGSSVLISAGICKGVKMTGSAAILDDLRNAGAILESGRVVVDHNVVTSGSTNDLPFFMKAALEVLAIHAERPLNAGV